MYHTPVQQQQTAVELARVGWSVLLGGGAVQACGRSSNTKATMTLIYDGPAHRSRYQC